MGEITMIDILVWDALIAWRDDILKKDVLRKSKTDYLSNMAKLIEKGIIYLDQTLSEFKVNEEDNLKVIENTFEWSLSTRLSRKTLLRSFYIFIKQNKVKKTNVEIPFKELRNINKAISELLSSNEVKAMSLAITEEDIPRFLRELCFINPRDGLVCWMMWEFKCTIIQILNLRINDIDFDNDIIRFEGESRISPNGGIRSDLKQCILEQSKEKFGLDLLFSTVTGKKINSMQIARNMRTASKRANLPVILTPKILYANAQAYALNAYQRIPEEERKKLSNEYARKIKSIDEKSKNVFVG